MIYIFYLLVSVILLSIYVYYIRKNQINSDLPTFSSSIAYTIAPTLAPTLAPTPTQPPNVENLISIVNLTISTSDNFYVSNKGYKITYDLIQTIKLNNPELIKDKTFSELEMIINSDVSESYKKVIEVLIDMLRKVALIFNVKPSLIKVNDISDKNILLNLDFVSELDNPMEAIDSIKKTLMNKNELGNKVNIISNGFDPDSVNLISQNITVYKEKKEFTIPKKNNKPLKNFVTNDIWHPPLWWEINMEKLKNNN